MSDQVPNVVQPQPTPFTYQVGKAVMSDGNEWVVINLLQLTGATVLFMSQADAKNLSDMLAKHASSLIVTHQIPTNQINGMDDLMKKIKGNG